MDRLEDSPACPRCAAPLAEEGAPCPWCLGKGLHPFQRIVRLGVFHDPLKDLIHKMKYNRQWPVGELLAHRLWEHEPAQALLKCADRIVPVPLYRWRQVERGYNQAEVIARRLVQLSGNSLAQPAVRLRNTPTQTEFHSRAKRVENLRDAFGLTRPQDIFARHVVVVDDVMTTGATLQSLGRVLRQAAPASLSAIVLAIADPRGRDFQAF